MVGNLVNLLYLSNEHLRINLYQSCMKQKIKSIYILLNTIRQCNNYVVDKAELKSTDVIFIVKSCGSNFLW